MRGTVSLNAPSYQPALVGTRPQGNSLLASLAEKTGRAPVTDEPAAGPDPTQSREPGPTEAEPQARRDIAQFKQALAAADTPAQLLANPVALKVLLTSHGLADEAGNSALAMRVLLSNSARANSLLNQLKDPRWLAVNNLYSFATQGLATLRNPETVAAIARCYIEALRVTSLAQTPPLSQNVPTCPVPSETG
jgi:hypothetical protein